MGTRFNLRRKRNSHEQTWWYPSEQYRHRSDDLWRQYQNGHIDYAKYLELLETIKTEELDRHDKNHPLLANDPKSYEKIENGIWRYEHLSQSVRMEEARRKAEAERIQALSLTLYILGKDRRHKAIPR